MTKVCFQGDELHFRLVGVWLFKLGKLFENGKRMYAVCCYEFVVDCEYITVRPVIRISDLDTKIFQSNFMVDECPWGIEITHFS
jgi:hypothetical protein